MSDETTVGNVEQSVGVAIGSNNQAVNVTIGTLEPPANMRETIKAMWVMLVTDQLERRERQEETDKHRVYVTERLDTIDRQIQLPTEHLGRLDGQIKAITTRIDRIDEQIRTIDLRTAISLALGGIATLVLIGVALYVTYAI